MKNIGTVDSKFRYVIIAAKRAKQLLKGAKPKIKSKSKNPIRIAQEEVMSGQVEYEIIPVGAEEVIERDEGVPVAAPAVTEDVEEVVEADGKDVNDEEEETEEESEEEESEEEEDGGIDGIVKEDKDD